MKYLEINIHSHGQVNHGTITFQQEPEYMYSTETGDIEIVFLDGDKEVEITLAKKIVDKIKGMT